MAASTQNENLAHPSSGSAAIDFAERLESLKAGIVAGLATAFAFGFVMVVNQHLLVPHIAALAGLPSYTNPWNWLVSGTIAALAGFLFGVTYRYIIRQDRNPHLRSGAVLAFGLVRGLAQVDVGLQLQSLLLPLGALAAESLLLFAIARVVLDWVLHQGWLKPFRSI